MIRRAIRAANRLRMRAVLYPRTLSPRPSPHWSPRPMPFAKAAAVYVRDPAGKERAVPPRCRPLCRPQCRISLSFRTDRISSFCLQFCLQFSLQFCRQYPSMKIPTPMRVVNRVNNVTKELCHTLNYNLPRYCLKTDFKRSLKKFKRNLKELLKIFSRNYHVYVKGFRRYQTDSNRFKPIQTDFNSSPKI